MEKPTKVYRTKITRRCIKYALAPFISSLVMFSFAVEAARKFHPRDPSRLPFVGIPALVGLAVLLIFAYIIHRYIGREVQVKGHRLKYKDSKHEVEFDIRNMAYLPPGKELLKRIVFSDEKVLLTMPELFLEQDEFLELAEYIRNMREARNQGSQKTFSL